jgi:hypothetical protein
MRSAFLFPLSLSLIAVAGCGSQAQDPKPGSDLKRDLTIVSQASQAAVATPIELEQVRPRTVSRSTVSARHSVRHRAASRSAVRAPKPLPVTAVAAAAPAASPAPAVVEPTNTAPANPRELPPGKTVTVIPVSTGSSTGTDEGAAPRFGTGGSGMGGGERAGGGSGMGGDCPRPDFGPAVATAGGRRGLLY